MPNYQQYQRYKRQPEGSGFKFGKILVILAIIFVIYLIGRAIWGGSGELESTLPAENTSTEVVDEETNTNTNVNAEEETNTNTNVNTATAGSFDLETCTRVYSRGGSDEKQVSLTFNVGTAKEGEIQKVLDTLSNTSTPADFFARGDVAEENPDLINKISGGGFSVYNLSYNHPHFNDLPESGVTEQLTKAEEAISQRTNKTTKPFFRPPYGEADEDVLAAVSAAGYCPVTWTVDAMDWSTAYTTEQSKERVLSNVANGAIVLMQASNSTTADILPSVISQLKEQGYNIVNLDTLLTQ